MGRRLIGRIEWRVEWGILSVASRYIVERGREWIGYVCQRLFFFVWGILGLFWGGWGLILVLFHF